VYTHLIFTRETLQDPPKSPFSRGTLSPIPPFLRGAMGDHCSDRSTLRTYVYTVAQEGMVFAPFSSEYFSLVLTALRQ